MTTYTAFGQPSSPTGSVDGGSGNRTWGLAFQVAGSASATALWWYSPPSSPHLPNWVGVYDTQTQNPVVANASPSWSGAAGSGWVRAAVTSTALTVSHYYAAAVAFADESSSTWAAGGYWSSGAGSSGIVNGPLSVPSDAQATSAGLPGQGCIKSGDPLYPSVPVGAVNWWLDIEVTAAVAAPSSGLLLAAIV